MAGAFALAGAAVEPSIELPESPQGKAAALLRVAAQIEHALTAQYLYAGYSFQQTERAIIDVAVEDSACPATATRSSCASSNRSPRPTRGGGCTWCATTTPPTNTRQ